MSKPQPAGTPGWAQPYLARRWHFFNADKHSLCGKWKWDGETQAGDAAPGPAATCVICAALLAKSCKAKAQQGRKPGKPPAPRPQLTWPLVYLASPYTDPDPTVRATRFQLAVEATAAIMRGGGLVFSPIVHSHPLTAHGLPATDGDFWWPWNSTMLSACDELWILALPGWEESAGIERERAQAMADGMRERIVTLAELEAKGG